MNRATRLSGLSPAWLLACAVIYAVLLHSAVARLPSSIAELDGSLTPRTIHTPRHQSLLARDVRIEGFRTDTEQDLVVDTVHPSFTWQLDAELGIDGELRTGVYQVRYELDVVLASSTSSSSVQSVATNRSTHVVHTGPALLPDRRYTWRLRYLSSTGSLSEWAQGSFRTGLMPGASNVSPFDGVWIGSQSINMNQLRREFTVPAGVQSATVFLSGMGLYELYVNGQRVDETRRLDPGWTEYELRVLYVSFDVTALLQAGQLNCVGVMLGNGWYAPEQWFMVQHPEYGPPRLLLQLNLHLTNGSVVTVVSDELWTGREGPISHDGIYWGENFEQRNERDGWSVAGFTDRTSLWLQAEQLPSPLTTDGVMSLQSMPPIRIGAGSLHTDLLGMEQVEWKGERADDDLWGAPINAVSIQPAYTSPAGDVDVFDLQQNMAGVCSVTLIADGMPGPRHLQMRHSESINPRYPNGVVYPVINIDGLRGSMATNTYGFLGNVSAGPVTYQPRFSYYGFRWFTFYNGHNVLDLNSVVCYPVHSETSLIGLFNSSSPVLNQLMHNMVWSQRSNIMGVPTACSQRDERSPWTGDNGLSVDQALYSLDLTTLYTNWLQLILDVQLSDGSIPDVVPSTNGYGLADPNCQRLTHPTGHRYRRGTAYLRVVDAIYDHTGDLSVVSKYFDGMRGWVERVRVEYNKTGLAGLYAWYGDWVPPPPYGRTSDSLVSSYAFLNDVRSIVKFAQLLNLTTWQAEYSQLYSSLTTEFHTAFWSNGTSCYADCAQTANVLALALPGVVPPELKATVLKSVVGDLQANGLTVGIIGLSQLHTVLSANGYHDVALQQATSTSYPSFGWQWNNEFDNATTLWELWDSCMEGSEMNSKNHVMFSSIGSWMWREVAGINLNGLGQHITIRPRQGYSRSLLPHFAVRLMTLKGLVSVELNRTSELTTSLTVVVPPNLHAHIVLEPAVTGAAPVRLDHRGQNVWNSVRGSRVDESGSGLSGRGILSVGEEDGGLSGRLVVVRVESGRFALNAQWRQNELEDKLGSVLASVAGQ